MPHCHIVVGVTAERTFQTVSSEKLANTPLVSYTSAGGLMMLPMITFKVSKIKAECREAAPSGNFIRGSTKGYINGCLFRGYEKQSFRFLKEKKILANSLKALLLLGIH